MNKRQRDNIKGWAVMTPILIYFALFTVVPIVILFVMSFTNYGETIKAGKFVSEWVGWKNYADVFRYPEYFRSIFITFAIAVGVVAAGMTFGFLASLAMKAIVKGSTFFRMIWYIPGLLSGAIVSEFFNMMLANDGTINRIIESLGGQMIAWKLSTGWMYFWIIFIVTWGGTGGTAMYFLAGLNGIDKEIYEAAYLDGVNKRQKMWYITLPLLRPMLGYILITGFIGAFNIFEPVLLISNGGPDQSTKVVLYRLYDEAFKNFKYGFSCALSVIVMIIVLALTFINIRISDSGILKVEEK